MLSRLCFNSGCLTDVNDLDVDIMMLAVLEDCVNYIVLISKPRKRVVARKIFVLMGFDTEFGCSRVMTEVLNADGTSHESNARATIDDDDNDFWFGFEQEYFIMDVHTQLPLGFPIGGYPGPQGMYYCSVGGKNTWGRDLVEEHANLCIDAGLNFEGINQEVAAGQWEFQLFAIGAKKAGDEIWIARYLLDRLTVMATILITTLNPSREIGMVLVCYVLTRIWFH